MNKTNKAPFISKYHIRYAQTSDIATMQNIRNNVDENTLSDPTLIRFQDYEIHLQAEGTTWVCEFENEIMGFCTINTKRNNLWALFVKNGMERKGIGQLLLDTALRHYFSETTNSLQLTTDPNTRAAQFYTKNDWVCVGTIDNELLFEMSYNNWNTLKK